MSHPLSPAKRRVWRWALTGLALFAGAGLIFVAWATLIPAPMPQALDALRTDAQVEVQTAPWLVFRPRGGEPTIGLIFYPGGRVDERAYAPAARVIAAAGYLVVIPPMPLHLAVFAPGRAAEIEAAFPTIQRWAVGGHSLGGAMAAQFAYQNPQKVQGLVLWAAYPAGSASLAASRLAVVSISGSQDGLATPQKIGASRALLPESTTWVVIQGGDHGQFGWYGAQSGDLPASISREEQQAQAVAATLDLLKSLERTQSMVDQKQRIEQAWKKTRLWITQFDGAPTEAYLSNVDAETLPQAVMTLAGGASVFRIGAISGKGGDQSQDISPESLQENLAKLQVGKVSALNVNAMVNPGSFDLDLHIVLHTLGSRKVDLEIVWWADQVFPDGIDTQARIRELLGYFMELQTLFGAPKLFIGPEAYEKPGPGSLTWLEI
jgi:pimeloyl-ACP methyl ester carboxylesterase